MIKQSTSTDENIRLALHAKRFWRAKARPDTLVIDELGLAHARSRVDIAVINGCIHGYEIKSGKDTLDRLDSQLNIYRKTLQRLTIVAASGHMAEIVTRVPLWCGLIEAVEGSKGGISFRAIRSAISNPEVDPVMVAHLLWRSEVIELLSQLGYTLRDLRRPRKHLYEMLCKSMSIQDVIASIRTFMPQRKAWRDRPAHAQCGD